MIFKYFFSLTQSLEPEPKLQYTSSRSDQKFQLLAAPAPQHWLKQKCHTFLLVDERSGFLLNTGTVNSFLTKIYSVPYI
jgi:hypothetical protein